MAKRKLISVIVLSTITLSLFVSCFSEEYWPGFRWRDSEPEKQGMDPELLRQISDHVKKDLSGTTSVLVIRNGNIVFEEYYKGDKKTLRDAWSVTKSFTSALTGIAIEQGVLEGVDQKIIGFFPEFDTGELNPYVRDITIRHLLTMTSGFNETNYDTFILKEMKSMLESSEQSPPGGPFIYGSSGPQLLSMVITKTTGKTLEEYGKQNLFDPLGITHYKWTTFYGYTFGDDGLQLRSRDMAKMGYLYLKQGRWKNKQLISPEWIHESTHYQVELPNAARPEGSYGYLWYPNSTHGIYAFMAFGAGGQIIYVIPDLDLIIVITGENILGVWLEPLSIIDDYVVPAIIE
jgi:CubicO group peptidase (beta-lactamase class C family)